MTPDQLAAMTAWLDEIEIENSSSFPEGAEFKEQIEYLNKGKRDLDALMAVILRHVATAVDFNRINDKILGNRAVDGRGLRALLDEFKRHGLDDVQMADKGQAFRPYDKLEEYVDAVVTHHAKVEPAAIKEALGLWGDMYAMFLVFAAIKKGKSLEQLTQMIRSKLELLHSDTLAYYIELMKFAVASWKPGPLDLELQAMTKLRSKEELNSALARFIVESVPTAVVKHDKDETYFRPAMPVGLSLIMSWTAKNANVQLSPEEHLVVGIVRDLNRLAEHHSAITVTGWLGLPEEDVVVGGAKLSSYSHNGLLVGQKAIVRELRRLLRATTLFQKLPNELEEILWRFKIGEEWRAADTRADWIRRIEVWHQRYLAKYLTDSGFRCYGAQIGRGQLDLLVRSNPEVVLEAKVYRDVPTEIELLANLNQLLAYLETQPFLRKGVLYILNFSDVLITEPRELIHGRVHMLYSTFMRLRLAS